MGLKAIGTTGKLLVVPPLQQSWMQFFLPATKQELNISAWLSLQPSSSCGEWERIQTSRLRGRLCMT